MPTPGGHLVPQGRVSDVFRLHHQHRALALNHLIPSDDPDYGESDWKDAVSPIWDGPFHPGYDGLRIELD